MFNWKKALPLIALLLSQACCATQGLTGSQLTQLPPSTTSQVKPSETKSVPCALLFIPQLSRSDTDGTKEQIAKLSLNIETACDFK